MQRLQSNDVVSHCQATLSDAAPGDSQEDALAARVTRFHLRQRLGLEEAGEARVFGQGRNFFHLENWYSVHSLIRNVLRFAGLHRRGRRNALRIELRHNDLVLDGLPRPFDGFTLLHLSDLHLDMNADMPHALIERLRGVEYDVAVITGDFRAKTFGPYEPTVNALRQVRVHIKKAVYAVLGNHDSIRMVPSMEEMGIRVLLNESVPIERGPDTIYLAGIDDPHYFRADNMEKAAEQIPSDAVAILLAHSPEIYRQAAHAGFVAMLCGHTHGGQICLPGGIPLMVNASCPRRYCAGRWTHHSLLGYTSVGSGASMVDVRFNCPPEVTLHHLRSA